MNTFIVEYIQLLKTHSNEYIIRFQLFGFVFYI